MTEPIDENFYKTLEVLFDCGLDEIKYPTNPNEFIYCIRKKDGFLYDKKSNKKFVPVPSINHPGIIKVLQQNVKKLLLANKVDRETFLKEMSKKK
jgi:hypothetical protein